MIRRLIILLLIVGCEEFAPTESNKHGCLDSQACNYDSSATIDNNSCIYEVDCAGVCGGDKLLDNCDVCDNDATNDCEEIVDEIQSPETIITTVETLFESSSVSLNWVGNDYAQSFSYRLEPLSYSDTVRTYTNWTEWDTTTVVNFENLDDGFYDFYIRGRFTSDIIEDPIILTFEVDAVSGTALRVYPLYQQVKRGESCDFYIYVEDVVDLAAMELNLTYNSNLLTFNTLTQGASLSNASIFLEETSNAGGIGTINFIALIEQFTGTGSLAKVTVTANQITQTSQEGTVTINPTSSFKDSNNNTIVINGIFNGIIDVMQ